MLSIIFFGGIILSLFLVLNNPPKWIIEKEKTKNWKNLNILAFSISLLIFAFILFFQFNKYNIFLFSGLGFLSYISVISLYTDVNFRLVDRRILNIFIVCSLIISIFVIDGMDEPNLVVYIFLLLTTFSTIFLPIFGASDGRILALGTILVYPVGELRYFTIALIIMAVSVSIYAFIIKLKQYKNNEKKEKVSIPAVPFFSISFLIALIMALLSFA